ncbi:MAG TPA: hypothetical protein VN742_12630 [Candidatus Binataceae bacterium]|nr:hypothetical protein [Candidatus Binataceae bacterium]
MPHEDGGSPERPLIGDPIVDAVKSLNSGYNNSKYSKRHLAQAGQGNIWAVVFLGENQQWYENYVYVLGSRMEAFYNLQILLAAKGHSFVPSLRDLDFIRLIVVAAMALLLVTATIYVSISDTKSSSLQVLSPLLTLVVGYLMGNVPGKV